MKSKEARTTKGRTYRLRLKGLRSPHGTIPLAALQDVSRALLESSERALRLLVEGTSVKTGPVPAWLRQSLDLTVTGIAKGSTVLVIEAPALGETAPDLINQQHLWAKPPEPDETVLTILTKSVDDAVSRRLTSDRYDKGVLDALLGFKPFLGRYAESLSLDPATRAERGFSIDEASVDAFGELRLRTPEPQAVTIAGLFDLIKHSGGKFSLQIEDGPTLRGKIDPSLVTHDQMREHWGKKVTIKGKAHFSPSGRIRFLEAHVIKLFQSGEEVFEAVPESQATLVFERPGTKRGSEKGFLEDIRGKWPGEETMDELLAALRGTETSN